MSVIRPEPVLLLLAALVLAGPAAAQTLGGDQEPGQHFEIRAEDLPLPAVNNMPYVINAPDKVARGEHVPLVPDGFTVTLFADSLPHPRRIEVLADGTVLVVQQWTGEIISLRDEDGDGTAELGGVFARGFNQPFGIATIPSGDLAGDILIADVEAVWRIPYVTKGNISRVTAPRAFGEPAGHVTRALVIDPEDLGLFVAVGSVNNLEEEGEPKATVQHFAADGSAQMSFARGMRNATGLRLNPATGELYAVVMERDAMGDDLVPDFFTRVDEGDDFGWPYQYAGGFAQPEYATQGVKRVAADLPDVMFEAHSAPMDLIFLPDTWPEDYRGDAIVALKGSSEPHGTDRLQARPHSVRR